MNLFDTIQPTPRQMSRRTDPETSREAAANMLRRGTLSGHNRLIVEWLESHANGTAGEIGAGCGLTSVQVARRMKHLVDSGIVRCGEARKCSVMGTAMMTYYRIGGAA